jgi:hypothetical protein
VTFECKELVSWAGSWFAWGWLRIKPRSRTCVWRQHSRTNETTNSTPGSESYSTDILALQLDCHARRQQASHLAERSFSCRMALLPAVCCFLWVSFHNNFIANVTQLLSHLVWNPNTTALYWSLFWVFSFHSSPSHSCICVQCYSLMEV